MAIKRPTLYSGLAIAGLTLTSGAVFCAKIESARNSIAQTVLKEQAAERRAIAEVGASADPAAKESELGACQKIAADCEKMSSAMLGTRGNVTRKVFEECETIETPKLHDACLEIGMRGLLGTALRESSDYVKCAQKVTECFDGIKRE